MRIAVIGRHALYAYLASNTAMNASAAASEVNAKVRAFWIGVRPGAAASWRTIGLQFCGHTAIQNRATSVCSVLRLSLVRPPRSFTSSKSRAHSAVASAGGAAGRTGRAAA